MKCHTARNLEKNQNSKVIQSINSFVESCCRSCKVCSCLNTLEMWILSNFTAWKTDTSNTSVTRVQQEWDTSAIQVNSFDFSHPYFSYITNKCLQGEKELYCKNYLLEMPPSHVKMRLKRPLQKLDFVMAKTISKSYTLDCSCKCSCTFSHSQA